MDVQDQTLPVEDHGDPDAAWAAADGQDDEVQDINDDEAWAEADGAGDEAVEADPPDDPEDGDEYEAAEDDEPEAGEEAEETPVREWDGQTSTLPPPTVIEGVMYDLRKTHSQMVQAYQGRVREGYEQRDQKINALESRLAQIEQTQEAAADVRPANPTAEMTPEQQQARWDEISRWNTRQVLREGKQPEAAPQQEQQGTQITQDELNQRAMTVAAQPGYTEEIGQRMSEIAQSSPYWMNQYAQGGGGEIALFEHAKSTLEIARLTETAAKAEKKSVVRKSRARGAATSRSGGSRATSAVERYKNANWDDMDELTLRQTGG